MILIRRTIFFYIFITICYRIMGKREIGELGITDIMISTLMGQLVAINIENFNEPITNTIIPITTLVILEKILTEFTFKSRKLSKIIDGKTTIIINDGKIIYKNMIKEKYTIDELLIELRINGISSIEEVKYAFLEPNGKISIIQKNINPLPLIIEGKIQYQTLKLINKKESWLLKEISKNNLSLKDIFYCILKSKKLYIIKYEDSSKEQQQII